MSENAESLKVYKVPSDNMGVLAAKFQKLAKRAKKLGLPAPTFTEIKVERVTKDDGRVTLLHHITIDPGTTSIKVDGWEFVATIQHTEEGNIIRAIGGAEIPTKYRTVGQYCEHCKTDRNRKDTYLLRKVE